MVRFPLRRIGVGLCKTRVGHKWPWEVGQHTCRWHDQRGAKLVWGCSLSMGGERRSCWRSNAFSMGFIHTQQGRAVNEKGTSIIARMSVLFTSTLLKNASFIRWIFRMLPCSVECIWIESYDWTPTREPFQAHLSQWWWCLRQKFVKLMTCFLTAGDSMYSPEQLSWCGTHNPYSVISPGPQVFIRFKSNDIRIHQREGVKMDFSLFSKWCHLQLPWNTKRATLNIGFLCP